MASSRENSTGFASGPYSRSSGDEVDVLQHDHRGLQVAGELGDGPDGVQRRPRQQQHRGAGHLLHDVAGVVWVLPVPGGPYSSSPRLRCWPAARSASPLRRRSPCPGCNVQQDLSCALVDLRAEARHATSVRTRSTPVGTRAEPPYRSVRQAQGLSLREVARRAGIDPAHLWRVERGTAGLSVASLARLAEVLGLAELARLLLPYVHEDKR